MQMICSNQVNQQTNWVGRERERERERESLSLPGEAACLEMELKVPRGSEAEIEPSALRRGDRDCISFFPSLRIRCSLVSVFL